MAFLIYLHDRPGGPPRVFAFDRSPVRIGRNPLNDVTLDHPFVSQWHALVRFEGQQVSFMDLGSTNGSSVNGHRLAPQQAVSIGGPHDEIVIGPLKLTVNFGPASIATEGARNSNFETNKLNGKATIVSAGTGARTAVLEPGTGSGADAVKAVLGAVDVIRPAYDAYRESWKHVLVQLDHQMRNLPAEVRPTAARGLVRALPQLAVEPEVRALFDELGIDASEFQFADPRAWLTRLSGRAESQRNQIHVGAAMERVGALLEAFGASYVELRKGMEQFGAEMGLQLADDGAGVHRAQSGSEVLTHLLDWQRDGNERVRELRRSFADVALHQVAMLNGVMAGTRALLDEMSPESMSKSSGSTAIAVRKPSLFARLFGGGARWARYRATHQAMTEEDRFSKVLFGKEFMRAYYTVVGSNSEGR